MKELTSTNNQFVKDLIQLRDKSRLRKKTKEFVFEGLRELSLALKGGYTIKSVLFCEQLLSEVKLLEVLKGTDAEVIKVSVEVYKKMAYRDSTEGVIVHALSKDHSIDNLKLEKENSLILVCQSIEKPGNVGAMLRTADAANIDLVILADPLSDIYNSNVIRSSVGCVFTNKVVSGETQQIIKFLKENNISIYSAALSASKPYHSVDFSKSSAIVVGTEATGLSREWLDASDQNIIIPMEGEIDSMNVSVSAAIILFEAKRQRI
jgi:TrmH family RNA methyltransferase